MPKGYKRPKTGHDLKSPGLRKKSSKKNPSPNKQKTMDLNINDLKEGGETESNELEDAQIGSDQEESEYDEEEGNSDELSDE